MDRTPPSSIISLPSLSASLCNLPNATSIQNISIHPSMYATRAAESEAKLQKVLAKSSSSNKSANMCLATPALESLNSSSPPLMMKKAKPKFST